MPGTDAFTHRFIPVGKQSPVLLLLHGTGGNEDDLLDLGRSLHPGAALLSPRGKVLENGMPRFFRRLAEGIFDEADLIRRTHELADFVAAAAAELRASDTEDRCRWLLKWRKHRREYPSLEARNFSRRGAIAGDAPDCSRELAKSCRDSGVPRSWEKRPLHSSRRNGSTRRSASKSRRRPYPAMERSRPSARTRRNRRNENLAKT